MGILARLIRWRTRHEAAVLEALESGPKTGKELKAVGMEGVTCYAVLYNMEQRGLIESEVQDPKHGVRRVYRMCRVVGTSEGSC